MNVIFLDIDGVLNSEAMLAALDVRHRDGCQQLVPQMIEGEPFGRCQCYRLENQIDPVAVARLNALVARTGAKGVISSSWRKLIDVPTITEILVRFGFKGEVIGETPDLVNDQPWLATNRWYREAFEHIQRGHEIWTWLAEHPEVEQFVILDDCRDMWKLHTCHVLTDAAVGLVDPDVERAVRLMGLSGGAVKATHEHVDAALRRACVSCRKLIDRKPGTFVLSIENIDAWHRECVAV